MQTGLKRLTGALALILSAGCVPLTPYSEIRARLPADSLLEVDGSLAHVVRSGAGEPLVLLHGFGASAYSWRHVRAALESDYEVVAIDLNGFGFSERPRSFDAYTVTGQLALVLGVMDRLGIDSAHVAGHSYGGALAQNLAWRHPERVRSLVLVDSAGAAWPWTRRTALASVAPLTHLYVRARAITRANIARGLERSVADDDLVTPELVDAYHQRVRIEGVSHAFRALTVPTSDPKRVPELERLDLPVLLVWGAEDTLTTPAGARRAVEILPRAELVMLEGVGHLPLEESPDRLIEPMRRFLERHSGGVAAERPAEPPAGRPARASSRP